MKISVMGSAFGPPTLGHFDVISQVDDKSDAIILVPCFRHGFGKVMVPFESRLALSKRFCEDVSTRLSSKLIVEDIERGMAQGNDKPVYTFDVMVELEKKYPTAELTFVMGNDNWDQFHKFYKGREIVSRWGVHIAEERSFTRSTVVRSLFVEQASENEICKHITKGVYDYIIENTVY